MRLTSTGRIFHGKTSNSGNNKDFTIKKIPIPVPIRRVSSLECDNKNPLPSMIVFNKKNYYNGNNLKNFSTKNCSDNSNYHDNNTNNIDINNMTENNSKNRSLLELQQKNMNLNSSVKYG